MYPKFSFKLLLFVIQTLSEEYASALPRHPKSRKLAFESHTARQRLTGNLQQNCISSIVALNLITKQLMRKRRVYHKV